MSIVTDERLMAYADGALPPDEARALEIMIEEDPALAARLTPFAMTGAPLAEVFDKIAAEPVPDRLVEAIAARAGTSKQRAPLKAMSAPKEGFASWLARALGLDQSGLAFANAFAVAGLVLAGGVAGWTLASGNTQQTAGDLMASNGGIIVASGPLASALESRPSSDGATDGIVTRSAFRAKEAAGTGSICREYRIQGGSGHFGGIACRSSDGLWRVATHTQLAAPAQKKAGYETASGDASPTLEATIGALIQGDILTADEEASTRARGWK